MDCHFLLQGIFPTQEFFPGFFQTQDSGVFPTQELNLGLLHWRQILYRLSYEGSPVRSMLLLLSRFSHVWLCATPWTAAHQALPSLGFSRQEHWSGLPFPSPMHESEKWKWSRSVMSRLPATPRTAAYQAPPSMGFSRQKYWSWVPLPSPY